jgi:cytochrome c oxidase subunit 1
LFLAGGLSGLYVAALGFDVHVTDTYFIIAHFHYIMVGGSVSAFIGGLYYWFPKMFGRMYSEFWGKIAAMIIFLGFNLTYFPQNLLGFMGMPRRYAAYPPEFQFLNIFSTLGASVLAVGVLISMANLGISLFKGKIAGDNPWLLPGLEWRTSSPPPTYNFDETPVVTWEAYDFTERNGLSDLVEERRRQELAVPVT